MFPNAVLTEFESVADRLVSMNSRKPAGRSLREERERTQTSGGGSGAGWAKVMEMRGSRRKARRRWSKFHDSYNLVTETNLRRGCAAAHFSAELDVFRQCDCADCAAHALH